MNLPTCDDCGFRFDPKDRRALRSERFGRSVCPLCHTLNHASTEWAIWNDCQGVFETRPRRKDAEALLPRYAGAQAVVVPVRVIKIEDAMAVFFASANEDEIEAARLERGNE